jgi:hypothetical protein
MLGFSISFSDFTKFHYFVDTTERGDSEVKGEGTAWGEREDDFTNNFIVIKQNISDFFVLKVSTFPKII